ncbi:MAG: hypothetical protein OXT65_09920 [Alphaproteobacteria bacterium]|nr:hypothetical protein [Alphaproteobacteria bacterium]
MWFFYMMAGLMTAGVAVKLMHPLMARGKWNHGKGVTRADRTLSGVLCIVLPLGALLAYVPQGRPDLPGKLAMFSSQHRMMSRHAALMSERQLQAVLENDVNNLGALMALAQTGMTLEDYVSATDYLQRALQVTKETQDPRHRIVAVSLGEVQVAANNGIVGDDALETFNYVLSLHPENPVGIYFLALRVAQKGDPETAMKAWRALLEGGHPKAWWKDRVRDSMVEWRGELSRKARK